MMYNSTQKCSVFVRYIKCLKVGIVKDGFNRFQTLMYITSYLTVFYVYLGSSKEGGAGAVDEDDFIKAFTDVPTVQVRCCVYSCLSSEMCYLQ